MSNRRKLRNLCLSAMLAAAALAPLHAQVQVKACPGGFGGTLLDAITAGTPGSSFQLCLIGQFDQSAAYNVQGNTPLAQFNVNGTQASPQGILVNVPKGFYAAVSNPNAPDTVIISITSAAPVPLVNNTFQVAPPLKPGPTLTVSPVGQAVSITLYTGGLGPFSNSLNSGTPPPMGALPASNPVWTGTPNQTGVYQYSVNTTDVWGNTLTINLASYVVPVPAITTLNPGSAVVGPGQISMTIAGSGFVAPTTVAGTAEPGSIVTWSPPVGAPTTLTVTNFQAGQLTVNIPGALLASTGISTVLVTNPSAVNSNEKPFTVNPSLFALFPLTRTAGTPAFSLGVSGTGFVNGSVVLADGKALPTTLVNGFNVTATFPSTPNSGPVVITVRNPDGTVTPVGATFGVLPQPIVVNLSPPAVAAGGPSFALSLNGSNLQDGMKVFFNGTALAGNLNGAQQLLATVPAGLISTPGTVQVSTSTADGYVSPNISFTITAAAPPFQFVNVSPLTSAVINTPFSVTFTTSGGNGASAFSISAGTVPAGLKLAGGTLSGTPTATGTSRFTMQATDASNAVTTRDFSLTVLPSALTLATGPLGNSPQNTPVSIQFAGSGGTPPYTFVVFGALPPGTQINSAGLLNGTPTTVGAYSFLVFITDNAGGAASQKYSLNITPPGLVITTAAPLVSGQLAVPYSTQLAATGGKGPTYTWSASGLPAGLTIASNTGLIAGIPRESGAFTVAVTVSDISGLTVTQNYALAIASSKLTVTTATLPNGAAGSSFAAGVSASGGDAPYSFTATGLPAGVSLTPTGIFSGSPTAAGSFNITVTVTDAKGLTATAAYSVSIAAKLVVTGLTLSNTVLGSPIGATKLAATGGTSPYQWQAANIAPGFALAADGTLSGTPTVQGTFSFTAFVVDSSGSLSSGTVQITVGLPAGPPVTISGLADTNAPATQPRMQVALAAPFPVAVNAKLTLTFVPDSGADDPAVQFSSGGRIAQIVIPAGSTGGLTDVGLQTGTVAGSISVTVQLLAGSQDVTPSPAPKRSIRVSPGAPVITAVTATRNGTGFTVVITGYASTRDVGTGAFQFSGSAGANLLTSQLSTAVTSLFSQWYASAAAAPYGSLFTLSQPFTVNGDTSSVLSVTVTLANGLGTSPAVTANLQ